MNKPTHLLIVGLAAASFSAVAAEKVDLSKIDLSKLPPAASKGGLTYETDIKPMMDASCVRCHGQERPKAGLRLDSLEGVLKGSKDGKVLKPGNGKESLLVIAAAQIDPDTAMPPKRGPGRGGPRGPGGPGGPGMQPPPAGQGGNPPGPGGPPPGAPHGFGGGNFGPPPKPLTSEQVSVLRAWVDQGAK